MTYTTLAFLNDERHTLAFLPGAHSTRSCVPPACLCSAPVTPVATPGVGRPKSGHVIVLSRCFRGVYLYLAKAKAEAYSTQREATSNEGNVNDT